MIIEIVSQGPQDESRLQGDMLTPATYEEHQITENRIRDMFWDNPALFGEAIGFDVLLLAKDRRLFENKRRVDLLGIAQDGSLVVSEFKREKSTVSALEQALAYAAACRSLTVDTILHLARDSYRRWQVDTEAAAEEALLDFISLATSEPSEAMNSDQRIVLLARHIDDDAAAVAAWLYMHGVKVTCVSLSLFTDAKEDGAREK